MAKKPNAPCAGCSELLWRSKTSATQPICRGCRRARRLAAVTKRARASRSCLGCGTEYIPRQDNQLRCKKGCGRQGRRAQRTCEICDQNYQPTYRDQRTCSRDCGWALRGRTWPASRVYFPVCFVCGTLFTTRRSKGRYCSAPCGRAGNALQVAQRYHLDPAHHDRVLARAHARRADKLGIGSARVVLSYLIARDGSRCGICHRLVRAQRGPMGPSIDHIIPLSLGGMHELVNVQLAHLVCNLRKHNTGIGDQLALFG